MIYAGYVQRHKPVQSIELFRERIQVTVTAHKLLHKQTPHWAVTVTSARLYPGTILIGGRQVFRLGELAGVCSQINDAMRLKFL